MFLSHLHFAEKGETVYCKSLNNIVHLIEDARQNEYAAKLNNSGMLACVLR